MSVQKGSSQPKLTFTSVVCAAIFLIGLFSLFRQLYTVRQEIVEVLSHQSNSSKPEGLQPGLPNISLPNVEPSFHEIPSSKYAKHPVDALGRRLEKPAGLRIVGVIFYGRRDRASILECYIRKNLVSNGGWLDEVIWAVNTDVEGDRIYAEEITKTAPEYTYLSLTPSGDSKIGPRDFNGVWQKAFTDEEAVYVKIDDDVVFMEHSAIPRLVTTLNQHPDALLVSSNVVNNPAIGWLHYHMGAVHAYMPEVEHMQEADHLASRENGRWRASELPPRNEVSWAMPAMEEFYRAFGVDSDDAIPKHRWVPVRGPNSIMQTPIALSQYDPFGSNLIYWALGAQAHYSLLQNLEENTLGRYFIVHSDDKASEITSPWQMTGTRVSINFIAIRGRDVVQNMEDIATGDDELHLTMDVPRALGRSVLVETTSVTAHFTFGAQKSIAKTDILERYHNYANDRVCPGAILEPEFYYKGEGRREELPIQ